MLHGTVIAPDESQFAVSTSKFPGIATGSAAAGGDVVVIPDAFLLFNCEFKRVGDDLKLIGEDGRTHTVPDYFKGDKHPTLATPQGAQIPAAVIDALAGGHHEQYAQAGAQPGTAEAIGKVATVAGNATIIRNGVAVTVNAGDVVLKNDVLRTGGDGALGVTFNDGTTFSLSANAQMSVNEFVYQDGGANNQAVFNLVRGSISFFASQVAKTGDMKVSTPTATMGIRGTTVVVDIDINTQTGNIGQVKIKLYADANGNVGRVEVFSTTGALLGTLTATATGFVITPGQTQPADAEQVSQQDAARDLALLQQLFNSTNIGNQLLQQGGPQDPQNPNPNTNGSNGSSTSQNVIVTLNQTQNDNGTTTTTIVDVVINPPPPPPADPNIPTNTPDPTPPIVIDTQNVPTVTTIVRGDGDDSIEGTSGADIIFAGGGNDTIYGSAGNDQIFGQGDDDTVSYERTTADLIVNLVIGTATSSEIGSDTLNSIERVIGGSGNDLFLVSGGAWSIDGGDGIDRIMLVDGTDILNGEDDGPYAANVEILDLNKTDSNTVEITLSDIIGLNDERIIRVVGGGEGSEDNFNVATSPYQFGYWRLAATEAEWTGDDATAGVDFRVFQFVNYWGQVVATVWIEEGVQSNLYELVEPVANPDINSVWEAGVFNGWPWPGDATVNGNVLFNDWEFVPGTTKTVISAGAGDASQASLHPFFGVLLVGTYGTLRIYANGQYQYTLNNNDPDTQALNWGDVGKDIFTYTMVDGQGNQATTTLTINVNGANDAPIIWGGQTTGTVIEAGYNSQGQPRGDATATGFLFKSDVDGSASNDTWSVVRGFGQTANPDGSVTGRYGTLSIGQNGQWTYTLDDDDPDTQALNLGDTRVETFTVRVTDEYGASDTQTVRVTVRGSSDNAAPQAGDVTLTANILGNGGFDDPVDFFGWTVSTLTSGTDDVVYSTAIVDRAGNIIVGDEAVAVLSFSGTVPVPGGTAFGPSIVSDAFVGVSGDTIRLIYQLSAGTNAGSGDLGTVTAYIRDALTGEILQEIEDKAPLQQSTGLREFNVALGHSGEFTIEFVVGSIDSTFGHVIGAQLAIGFAGILHNGFSEDVPATFAAEDFLAFATDPDNDPLVIFSVSQTSQYGALVTLNPDGSVTYDATGAENIQALNAGESIPDTFEFTISDGKGGFSTATAHITIFGVDEIETSPPQGWADSVDGYEDATLIGGTAFASDEDTPLEDLVFSLWLGEDGELEYGGAEHGTVVMQANGSFQYVPNANFAGIDYFYFVVFDGLNHSAPEQIAVNVYPVNDLPETHDVTANGRAGMPIEIDLDGDDALDASSGGWVTSFRIETLPENGSLYRETSDGLVSISAEQIISESDRVVFVPDDGWAGTTSFTYSAQDNDNTFDESPATATINVSPPVSATVLTNSGFDMTRIAEGIIEGILVPGQANPQTSNVILLDYEDAQLGVVRYEITSSNLDIDVETATVQEDFNLLGGTFTGLRILLGDEPIFVATGFEISATEMQAAIDYYDETSYHDGEVFYPGETYLVEDLLGAQAMSITGGQGDDVLTGTRFNDTIDGGGGADSIDGKAGDDLIIVRDNAAWSVNGGAGVDTLRFEGDFDLTDEQQEHDQEVTSVEIIDLGANGANHVTIDAHSIWEMSQGLNYNFGPMRVMGGEGDSVALVPIAGEYFGTWVDEGEVGSFDDGYTGDTIFNEYAFYDADLNWITNVYIQQGLVTSLVGGFNPYG